MVLPANIQYGGYGPLLSGTDSIVAQIVMNKVAMKTPTSVATTANITIATGLNAGDTIDGVTLVAGDRVLVWQQTAASENGVYIVDASPFRAADFDEDAEIRGAFVPVQSGTTYGGNLFRNTNTAAITVDTDDITFELFASSGGGTSIPFDHGAMGATETFDLADGEWQRATFDDDCTITLAGFSVDVGATMLIEFTIGGAGGWGATWDPDMVFIGNDQPPQTAGDVGFLLLWTSQGDSLIYAAWIGAGGLTVKDEGTPLATLAESLDFVGAGVAASGTGAAKTITIPGTTAAEIAAVSDLGDHEHIVDLFSGDGSTTVFEISQEPTDPEAVWATVAGLEVAITVGGAMSTQITFAVAPTSATDNTRIHYPAVVA